MDIQQWLFERGDEKYREFQYRLIPTAAEGTIIGVRTPELRALAKQLDGTEDAKKLLSSLPHEYHEENCVHAFLIERMKDYGECVERVEEFLPYVDNWAVCDQMSPKVFKKHRAELLEKIKVWIRSDRCYTVRFGLGMLMAHFLDGDFRPEYLELAAGVESQEYYINMMRAWLFATALAKQYDSAVIYFEQDTLDKWTHNKAIQKAAESFRVTPENKAYLKTLKRK